MERPPASPTKGHSRSRSATVLKSIISPKKTASPKKADAVEPSSPTKENRSASQGRVLGEISAQGGKSPKKLSRTLKKQRPEINPWTEPDTPLTPDETLLLSPTNPFAPKDKENTTPPRTGNSEPYTPIWAQFTSQPTQELSKLEQEQRKNLDTIAKSDQQSPSRSPRKASQGTQHTLSRPPPTPLIAANSSRPTSKGSPQKSSRILEAVAKFDGSMPEQEKATESKLDGKELDDAFETVLAARNIPELQREHMRGLDARIKRDFIKNEGRSRIASGSAVSDTGSQVSEGNDKKLRSKRSRDEGRRSLGEDNTRTSAEDPGSPSKRRSRSRSRTFTFSKGDRSKKSRSQSRPRSLMSLKNLSSSSVNSIGMDGSSEPKDTRRRSDPNEFVGFLRNAQVPEKVEVGKLQKLRRLLRHESVSWVDDFIIEGGMDAVVGLLRSIMKVEWREEHEDMLLHEALLCLKGLGTTEQALSKLNDLQPELFPELLNMLFDAERRGPAEYGTRGIITFLFFTHLSNAAPNQVQYRARTILSYLKDPAQPDSGQPTDFILKMSKPRPYKRWCKEVTSVTKEVFWIFLHHLNTVSCSTTSYSTLEDSYRTRHFPKERPPVPAAPYVGGVEWEATNYLASHLDLMNGILASLPTVAERNDLREELRTSGFEYVMGGTFRLCKEKFYGAVHDGLRTWVDAAAEDGWETIDVRQGPPKSPQKSSSAGPSKTQDPVPKLELPLGVEEEGRKHFAEDRWEF